MRPAAPGRMERGQAPRKRLPYSAALIAVLCASAACRGAGGGPPRIDYGRQACARCGMIVSEERFASGYVDAQGRSVAFDDLGELLAAAAEDRAIAGVTYVHDMGGEGWVPAVRAYYLRVPSLATPMGSGIAAFRDAGRAADFARQRGAAPVMEWEAALRAYGSSSMSARPLPGS